MINSCFFLSCLFFVFLSLCSFGLVAFLTSRRCRQRRKMSSRWRAEHDAFFKSVRAVFDCLNICHMYRNIVSSVPCVWCRALEHHVFAGCYNTFSWPLFSHVLPDVLGLMLFRSSGNLLPCWGFASAGLFYNVHSVCLLRGS